jgi:hypothetical protein
MLGDGSMKKISVVEKSTKRAYNKKNQANIAKMYAREIKKQTSVLSRGLNDLYSKPQLVPTKTGFIERSTDKRGNTTTLNDVWASHVNKTHAIYRRTDKKTGEIEYIGKSLNLFTKRLPPAILHNHVTRFTFNLVSSIEKECKALSLEVTPPLEEAAPPKATRKKTITKTDK